MSEPRVLITGLDGFTGPHLESELATAGYRIYGLGQNPSLASPTMLVGDITVPADVQRVVQAVAPQYVVHLAGLSFVARSSDEEAYYRVHVVGTLNLLDAIGRAGSPVKKILIASSGNVYGAVADDVLTESLCPRPVNHYGASKLAMEHLVATWFDRLPIVIARPFNYTGPGQAPKFVIPKIVSHFVDRRPTIELGSIDVEREFNDVRAVSRAYRLLLEANAAATVVNVCSGIAHSLRSILDIMAGIAGYRIDVQVNEALFRKNEIPRLVGSNRLLHQLIGEQRYPNIEETLRWMYASRTS